MRHKVLTRAAVWTVLLLAVLLTSRADAEQGWRLKLTDTPLAPPKFLAVDKDRQRLLVMQRRSPMVQVEQFSCTTGQNTGDKRKAGDLRTPEGVYFLQRKLTSGLDFALYGSMAFTLDFPNPVDKLRGKTGYGIWIHGRGDAIVPRETKGCVALNEEDLHKLEPSFRRGLPVVIARRVDVGDGVEPADTAADLADAALLKDRVLAWAEAWQSKSDAMFEFYDQKNYSRTWGRPFRRFEDHKRNLFDKLDWIQVMVHDVQALKGPDYWVTWFGQYYRTPHLASQGVKRLYWQRDKDGEMRIVGKDWDLADLGLEQVYLERMSQEMAAFVGGWSKAWQKGDLAAYGACYAPDAVQGDLNGKEAVVGHKRELWSKAPPARVEVSGLRVAMHQEGLAVEFKQRYQSSTGYGDEGLKRLVVRPQAGGWRIASEEWSAIQ